MKKSVKKVIKKNSGKNQGNKFLRNFIIIGVVVLILLFIFAMYSGKGEVEKENELASIRDIGILSSIGNFFGYGDEVVSEADSGFQEEAPTIAEIGGCTVDKDCKVCVQTCINNKCKDNGKILCDSGTPGEGKCVTYPEECECKEKCDPCLQRCSKTRGECENKQPPLYKCPGGECVVSKGLCSKCEPACKICEKCVQKQDPSGRDYYDCTPDWDLKDCGDGICVQPKEPCPQDCKPECIPCIQKCTSNGCEDTEMIWCSEDQSCRPKGFDCKVLAPKVVTKDCQPITVVRSDIEWDGSGDIATFCRNRGLEPGTTITYRTPSGSTTPVSCPCPI